MAALRNKFFLALAFFAAAFFLSVSLGGEFLHEHIHHHQTKASHDDCPLFQLAVQAFIFAVVFGLCLPEAFLDFVFTPLQAVVLSSKYFLPGLRAPPVSL